MPYFAHLLLVRTDTTADELPVLRTPTLRQFAACLLPTSSVTVSLSRFLVPSTIGALGDSCRPGGEGVINVRLGTRAALWGWPNNKGQHACHTWGICMGQCWRLLMVSATVSSWREPSHLSLRPGLRPGQDQMALRERDS